MTAHTGYPPFRMKAKDAASYCGMSETAFIRAVQSGEFPAGQRKTGGTFWLRRDLEQAMLGKPTHTQNFGQAI